MPASMTGNLSLQTLHFDTAEGIRLHAKACGPTDAPVLLFVHGFPECWFTWHRQLAEFSRDYRCVAIDLRGFNLSSQPTDVRAYKPSSLVADLCAVIHALGVPVHAVIAHDWGGAVAWSLGAQHPALMRHLVVLNAPHTITFARALATDEGQQAAGAYMNVLRLPGAEHILAQDDFAWLRELVGPLTDDELAVYRDCWTQGLTGGCNYYRASPLRPPLGDDPGANAVTLPREMLTVDVPTWVLWALDDIALCPGLIDGLDDYIPRLTLETVPGASHWIIHEQPGRVIAGLQAHLLLN